MSNQLDHQPTEGICLPELVTLPTAEQLAEIAAALGPDLSPDAAIKRAVSLVLRAAAFQAKHVKSTATDLAFACEDLELVQELLKAERERETGQTYGLEVGRKSDDVRTEIAKAGLKLKTTRSVLENLKACHRNVHIRGFLRMKRIPVTLDGSPLWVLGKPVESESDKAYVDQCRKVTQEEFDRQCEALAVKNGWRSEDFEEEWKGFLEGITERRTDRRIVYQISSFLLQELIQWKRSLKRSGGLKSRLARRSSNRP